MTPPVDADVPAGSALLDLPASPALGLSFLRAGARTTGLSRTSSEALPRVVLRLRDVRVDSAHVARYAAVVGAPGPGRPGGRAAPLPLLYPNVLSFPLQMALMTSPDFPFGVVGMVHLANDVRQERGLDPAVPLEIDVRAEHLRPHRLGRVLDVVTVVRQDGRVAWTQVATFLRRGRPAADAAPPGTPTRDVAIPNVATPDDLTQDGASADDDPVRPLTTWRLDAGLGRAYAAVAGDRNPIHLHPLTARPFGFRRPIAHGLWTAARLAHAVGDGMPDDVTCRATFRKPVPLPSTVDVLADRAPGPGPDGVAGAVHAQVRRHHDGALCCDLRLAPATAAAR